MYQEINRAVVPPGLIAYVDDHPAGWTRVGPRAAFPGVTGNKALSRMLPADDADAWWVTCFAVGSGYRRSGVGLALLEAAVEFARQHGARAIEGHPVDVAALKAAKVAPSALYTGTTAMFARRGLRGSSSHVSHAAGDETLTLRSRARAAGLASADPRRLPIRRGTEDTSRVRTSVHIGRYTGKSPWVTAVAASRHFTQGAWPAGDGAGDRSGAA